MKKEKFNLLGLQFNNLTFNETIEQLQHFIHTDKPHMVFAPNAELVVRANENSYLRDIYNKAHLLTVDSFILYYAARLLKKPVIEPVNAARLMFNLLEIIHRKGYRIYLLGAKETVLRKAVENIKSMYPGINIVGWHNGYFDFDNDKNIVEDIKAKAPDILFAGMSSPLKENFIAKNLEKMNVSVCLGVGGSFDIIAGKYRLAPEWVSRIGFEWFYRFIQEPGRLWKRYTIINTKFLCLVIKELCKGTGGKNGTIQEMV